MKIFIIAFACEPNRTSEPGVGWNIVKWLSRQHQLTVVTRANNRQIIEAAGGVEGVNWIFYDLPGWCCRLKKKLPFGSQIYHELWNYMVARVFQRKIKEADLVHQLTFGAAFFTPWAALCARHFVWGPVGGGDCPIDFSFLRQMGILSILKEMTYRLITNFACNGSFWSRRARARVDAVIFRTLEFSRRMRLPGSVNVSVVGETAYANLIQGREFSDGGPLRVLMVTRLIPHKAVVFAVRAFAKFIKDGGDGVLTVCGEGRQRSAMENVAEALGVATKVNFRGQIDHDAVLEELMNNDVLLHLSFREGGSWSILEAMAYGLPIVCQGRSGMDDMVAEDCGIKIHALNADDLIDRAARALGIYAMNRQLLERQGRAGQRRVATVYQWNRIADAISQVYCDVLDIKTKEP